MTLNTAELPRILEFPFHLNQPVDSELEELIEEFEEPFEEDLEIIANRINHKYDNLSKIPLVGQLVHKMYTKVVGNLTEQLLSEDHMSVKTKKDYLQQLEVNSHCLLDVAVLASIKIIPITETVQLSLTGLAISEPSLAPLIGAYLAVSQIAFTPAGFVRAGYLTTRSIISRLSKTEAPISYKNALLPSLIRYVGVVSPLMEVEPEMIKWYMNKNHPKLMNAIRKTSEVGIDVYCQISNSMGVSALAEPMKAAVSDKLYFNYNSPHCFQFITNHVLQEKYQESSVPITNNL